MSWGDRGPVSGSDPNESSERPGRNSAHKHSSECVGEHSDKVRNSYKQEVPTAPQKNKIGLSVMPVLDKQYSSVVTCFKA